MTKVKKIANVSSSVKQYTIFAVSIGALNTAGAFQFVDSDWVGRHKASDLIKKLLYEPRYGLTDVFYGMKNRELVEAQQLIRGDDAIVTIEAKSNISILDYLTYLVDCMSPAEASVSNASNKKTIIKKAVYVLLFEDGVDNNLDGPYFRIERSDKLRDKSFAYEIDIGYPSQNVVTNWEVEDDETYSLYYKFASQLQTNLYRETINDNGDIEMIFAPTVGSNNPQFKATEDEKTWWTKATISFKGLLRPAILMSYVRINILYYGRKDIDSGLYIVLSQQDTIDTNGYRTTLKLLRVGGDDTYVD